MRKGDTEVLSRLDEIRRETREAIDRKRAPDIVGDISITKCRGRCRLSTLRTAEKIAEAIPPYFCCLCHGYHVEHPTDE